MYHQLIWLLEKMKFAINSQKDAKIREFSVNFRVITAQRRLKINFGPKKFFGSPQKKIWGIQKLGFSL